PFDAVEAIQLAHSLTEKWWLHQQSRRKMEELEGMVAARTAELAGTNQALEAENTERKRAEAVVLRERNFVKDVLDAATQFSIIATGSDGLITVFNSGAERMLGYGAD